jgi:hypothetical protein
MIFSPSAGAARGTDEKRNQTAGARGRKQLPAGETQQNQEEKELN